MSTWLPLKQYAPELAGAFSVLEQQSRRPGEDASLPPTSNEEGNKLNADYEKRVREALRSDQPDELTINFAISRGDFDKAHKMIDKLTDSPQKTQLIETINVSEALSLAEKGDTYGSEMLAEKLNNATSILQVYPVLINKCVARKDQTRAIDLTYRAVRQLKRADIAPLTPPAGLPTPVIATSRERDSVLLSLSKLAKAVVTINDVLALEVLDEMVVTANRSEVETGQGRTGYETDVFKKLAAKNETRVRQAAETLQDPLRQIVALAAIYQWKADELAKRTKAQQQGKTTPRNSIEGNQVAVRP